MSHKEKPRTVNEKVRFTDKVIKQGMRNAAQHHIDSFDYAMEVVLPRVVPQLLAAEINAPTEQEVQ